MYVTVADIHHGQSYDAKHVQWQVRFVEFNAAIQKKVYFNLPWTFSRHRFTSPSHVYILLLQSSSNRKKSIDHYLSTVFSSVFLNTDIFNNKRTKRNYSSEKSHQKNISRSFVTQTRRKLGTLLQWCILTDHFETRAKKPSWRYQ
jgi:hypothetical protein